MACQPFLLSSLAKIRNILLCKQHCLFDEDDHANHTLSLLSRTRGAIILGASGAGGRHITLFTISDSFSLVPQTRLSLSFHLPSPSSLVSIYHSRASALQPKRPFFSFLKCRKLAGKTLPRLSRYKDNRGKN